MSVDQSFGRLLKELRRRLDLTQRDLARQVGYSIVTIRKVEADERRPSRELAERLAMCLQVTGRELPAFVALARAQPEEARWRLPHEFGQATTRQGPPSNLATPLTRLIGRHHEVPAVRDLLLLERERLVTLVGPPGIGKSRLGLQVATDLLTSFVDGVFFVALAPVTDPALFVPTIAKTLGVKESAAQSLVDCLMDHLRERRVLLLIDNVEHMLTAAPVVADLLTACPSLTILATSREPLRIRGERQFPVPPLALPTPGGPVTADGAARYAAIELFVERARAVSPEFELSDANVDDVAAVCSGLDGLPLAIELVAARANLLAPQQMLSRLDSPLALLTGGPRDLPARQRTLRDTIDWSYRLLDDGEQMLFARLAVFIGGCLLAAAEEIAVVGQADGDLPVLDGLAALADKNLLRQEERIDGERYFVFFETIREFALERLAERGEEAAVRERYAAYYVQLAETAGSHLAGQDQEAWLDRLDAEHNNLRAALEYRIQSGAADAALRMVAALWRFWHIRSHQTEAGRRVALAFALDGPHDPLTRARALFGAGWIATDQSDPVQARAYFDESVALFEQFDDQDGAAGARLGLGGTLQAEHRHAEARPLLRECLREYRRLGDDEGIAWALDQLGWTELCLDEADRAEALFDESIGIFRRLRHAWGIAVSAHHHGLAALARGEHDRARERLGEGMELFDELANGWGIAMSQYHLGHLALSVGDIDLATANFARGLTLYQAEDDRNGVVRSIAGLAAVAGAEGRLHRAACLLGAAEGLGESIPLRMSPFERRVHDRTIASVGSQIDDKIIAMARSGRSMTLAQAATYALTPRG